MKKRAVMIALLLTMTIAAAGCTKNSEETTKTDVSDTTEENETEAEQDTEEADDDQEKEPTTAELMAEIDVEKCVTLGEYKGITVEKTIEPVTDEDVEQEIQSALESYPVEVTNRSVQEGDTVNIDYVGRIDGEEFEGGSDEGALLKIGSGQFIEGFEDGLIGASKGETRVLALTFPQNYTEDLAGKAVEFTVTVNTINEPLEEPNDEWVAANIEGYYTVEEYKAGIRSEQEENNKQTAEEQMRYTAWTTVVDGCTINEYPETLVEMGKKLYTRQAETYAQYAGMELKEFIESSGITQEEFDANAEEYGKDVAAQALVNQAICNAEGYTIGDEAYQEAMTNMLAEYGCTEEELISAYGQDNVEQSIMMNRVIQLILDNAVIEEVEADAQ
ncbi:MAG: trigger factor [Oliverpabstia sp.]|nr:trigger factor [Lachnospiraceae bacterium]MDY5027824.1 trigger factor [Oliverpabstia sp.]